MDTEKMKRKSEKQRENRDFEILFFCIINLNRSGKKKIRIEKPKARHGDTVLFCFSLIFFLILTFAKRVFSGDLSRETLWT